MSKRWARWYKDIQNTLVPEAAQIPCEENLVMDEETLDIREYANVLLARWWLLALGPLLGVLAALMASQVDAVVMAVNANQTRQDSMDVTLENLGRANRNILGFIWNQRETGPFSQTSRNQRYLRFTPETSPNGAPSLDASFTQESDRLEPALSARS